MARQNSRSTEDVELRAIKAAYDHQNFTGLRNQLKAATSCSKWSTLAEEFALKVYTRSLIELVANDLHKSIDWTRFQGDYVEEHTDEVPITMETRGKLLLDHGEAFLQEQSITLNPIRQRIRHLSKLWEKEPEKVDRLFDCVSKRDMDSSEELHELLKEYDTEAIPEYLKWNKDQMIGEFSYDYVIHEVVKENNRNKSSKDISPHQENLPFGINLDDENFPYKVVIDPERKSLRLRVEFVDEEQRKWDKEGQVEMKLRRQLLEIKHGCAIAGDPEHTNNNNKEDLIKRRARLVQQMMYVHLNRDQKGVSNDVRCDDCVEQLYARIQAIERKLKKMGIEPVPNQKHQELFIDGERLFAISESANPEATLLSHLRIVMTPPSEHLQWNDRCLKDCRLYSLEPDNAIITEKLKEISGITEEFFLPIKIAQNRGLKHSRGKKKYFLEERWQPWPFKPTWKPSYNKDLMDSSILHYSHYDDPTNQFYKFYRKGLCQGAYEYLMEDKEACANDQQISERLAKTLKPYLITETLESRIGGYSFIAQQFVPEALNKQRAYIGRPKTKVFLHFHKLASFLAHQRPTPVQGRTRAFSDPPLSVSDCTGSEQDEPPPNKKQKSVPTGTITAPQSLRESGITYSSEPEEYDGPSTLTNVNEENNQGIAESIASTSVKLPPALVKYTDAGEEDSTLSLKSSGTIRKATESTVTDNEFGGRRESVESVSGPRDMVRKQNTDSSSAQERFFSLHEPRNGDYREPSTYSLRDKQNASTSTPQVTSPPVTSTWQQYRPLSNPASADRSQKPTISARENEEDSNEPTTSLSDMVYDPPPYNHEPSHPYSNIDLPSISSFKTAPSSIHRESNEKPMLPPDYTPQSLHPQGTAEPSHRRPSYNMATLPSPDRPAPLIPPQTATSSRQMTLPPYEQHISQLQSRENLPSPSGFDSSSRNHSNLPVHGKRRDEKGYGSMNDEIDHIYTPNTVGTRGRQGQEERRQGDGRDCERGYCDDAVRREMEVRKRQEDEAMERLRTNAAKRNAVQEQDTCCCKRDFVCEDFRTLLTAIKCCRKKSNRREDIGKVFEFQVVEDAKGMAKFQIGENNELYPEEVSVIMLDYLKAHAQEVSQRVVSQAVITVPANFDNAQREATLAAAKIAGLDVLRILNEPTAAALAYAYENRKNGRTELKKRSVLVYDLGGGTFDVSVVIIEGQTEKVVVTKGEQWLGGEDFDNIIYEAILPQVQETKRDLTPKDDWDIKLAAMEIKIELSRSVVARKTLSLQGGFTVKLEFTREEFDELCEHKFEKTRTCVIEAVDEAKRKVNGLEIDEVIVVGGSTRIVYIQTMLQKMFPGKIKKDINPDKTVALGAAVLASELVDKKAPRMKLRDVTPLSYGVAVKNGLFHKIVEANTSTPCKKSKQYQNADDGQESISVRIYEGENEEVEKNNLLATIKICFEGCKCGSLIIEETFEIDDNGTLLVTAKNKATGEPLIVRKEITNRSMTPEDIARCRAGHISRLQRDKAEGERRKKLGDHTAMLRRVERRAVATRGPDQARLQKAIIAEKAWKAKNEKASVDDITSRMNQLSNLLNLK